MYIPQISLYSMQKDKLWGKLHSYQSSVNSLQFTVNCAHFIVHREQTAFICPNYSLFNAVQFQM